MTRAAGRFLSAVKYLTVYLLVLEQVKHGLEIDRFVLSIGLALGINHWVEEIFHNIQYLQMNSVHVRNTRLALESCSSSVAASPSSQPPQKSGPEIRLEDVTVVFPEGTEPFLEHFNLTIHPGDKIAQGEFPFPYKADFKEISSEEFDKLTTSRGENGFGSSGK